MTVKEKLTILLNEHAGEYLSGEEIAAQLDCSRNAVWKAVKGLQEEGYNISAATNKGYMLAADSDILSCEEICKHMGEVSQRINLKVFKSVDSTNTVVRELAAEGAPEGTAAVSGEQTQGRGRLGRSFFSPSDTGLYLSILLRPKLSADEAVKITTAAAVAVCEAIEECCDISPEIKWVNDIYIGGRKVCGILTEAAFNMECGGLEYAVLGIGVNAYEPEGGFPEEIKDVAGAVFKSREKNLRSKLTGRIIADFMRYYRELTMGNPTYIDSYRRRLMWKNEQIKIIAGNKETVCTLIDADDECRLVVRDSDGEIRKVATGEISIRSLAVTGCSPHGLDTP